MEAKLPARLDRRHPTSPRRRSGPVPMRSGATWRDPARPGARREATPPASSASQAAGRAPIAALDYDRAMLRSALLLLLASAALAPTAWAASAQFVHGTVGPNPAPVGAPVSITVSNDNQGSWSSVPCPYRVFDASMNLVYDPPCPDTAILMGPFGWVTAEWPQIDQAGQPVPPGNYVIEVTYDGGFPPTLHPIRVGGVDANLVFEGTATIGQTITMEARHFYLAAPLDAGRPYFLAASLTATTGIATCGGTIPLDVDPLLNVTLGGGTIFQGAFGTLDASGTSKTPKLPIPPDPSLVGFHLESAFVVLDLAQPCVFRRISPAYGMTII